MEIQERVEREINLKELFWGLLLGWRQLICYGIIFAVLLCGMRYFLDVRSYRAAQNFDIEKAKEELETEDREKVENAVQIKKQISGYENYLEKSALMQLDPYEKPIVKLQYYVKSDYIINYTEDSFRDYTSEVTSMYCSYLTSGEVLQQIIDEAGLTISREDLGELLTVINQGTTFDISISYLDAEKLKEISSVVKKLLEEKSPEYQQIGSHTLKLIEESQNVIVDTELLDKKSNISSTLSSLKTQLNNLKSDMTGDQLKIFDVEAELEEEKEAQGFSVRYFVLGGLIGLFLACAWIAYKIIFASKLQSAEEIRSLYGIRLLGEVEEPDGKKKRFLSVLDNLFLRMKNKGKKKIPAQQQIKVLSASIILSCKQQGIDCIYITGSRYGELDSRVLDDLKKELSAQNIKVREGDNIKHDAVSLQEGIDTGKLLFVEQIGKSVYDEIYDEIQLAGELNADILGVVVLG